MDVHAKAGMVVDTGRVVEILAEVLEPVLHGDPVEALRRPWPSLKSTLNADASTANGMWWEKAKG